MLTWLLFIRHGESAHSVDGTVGGPRGDRGLTPRGHDQARALAGRLASSLGSGAFVYSSVLRRAVETAAPIAAALGVSAVADCGLCTWHMPAYADGLPTARFQAEHSGHAETVEAAFDVLGGQPPYRAFDLSVANASVTEWSTDSDPTGWPPPRWTLRRFNET